MKKGLVMSIILLAVFAQTAEAQVSPYANRLLLPHIYPGQSVTSGNHWQMEPLNVQSSTVRWTESGAYSVTVDKIHLERRSYTLIVKSRWGPEIKIVPFNETEINLGNQTFRVSYHKQTYTIWLSNYPK